MGGEIVLVRDETPPVEDYRARYYFSIGGNVLFNTLYPPNTSVPDRQNSICASVPEAPCTIANTNVVMSLRSRHPGVVNVVFADGSVHTISDGVDLLVYNAAGSREDGEAVGRIE
jgi:prepilin-type processing-associated H-X9-DG protein